MPARTAQDAIHVTMTDHWIQRTPARWASPTKEDHTPYRGGVVPFYSKPDALSLAVANVRVPSDASVQLLEQYLKRAPRDVPTLVALGKSLAELGRLGEAARHLRRAVALDSKHTGARVALGVALARQGKLTEALAELERATSSNPDDSFAWFNRAVTHRELRQFDQAAKAFREAIRLQPDLSAARVGLASLPK